MDMFDLNPDNNSTELSLTNCLKLILEEKKREKSHPHTWIPGPQENRENQLSDTYETNLHQTDDCMNLLKGVDHYLLLELIRNVTNTSIVTHMKTPDDSGLENLFVNEWYVVTIWSILFVSMVLIAMFGNSLIIWIIFRQKIMRTVINIFLLNLSISDLLTVTFNATFNFVFMLTGNWPFNYFYCVFNNFINNLTIASSVFTATVMSIDRYIAIVYPLKPRMTKKRALINISLIWLCSAFFASPTILYSKIITIPYNRHNERILCLLEWPDGLPEQSKFEFGYNIAFLLLTYILPMLTMAIAYTLMARVLWDSRQNTLNSNVQTDIITSKQKCVRMLIAMISVFGICWLPYHSYFLCTYFWPEIIKTKQIKHIYLAIYWLAMANSLFDPIILFTMNKRFRNCITTYIRCQCLSRNGTDYDFNSRMNPLPMRLATHQIGNQNKNTLQVNKYPSSNSIESNVTAVFARDNGFITQV